MKRLFSRSTGIALAILAVCIYHISGATANTHFFLGAPVLVSDKPPTGEDAYATVSAGSDAVHIVWSKRTPDGSWLYYRTVSPDLVSADPVIVTRHEGVFAVQLVVDSLGIGHLVWQGYLGQQSEQSGVYYHQIEEGNVSQPLYVSDNMPNGSPSSPVLKVDAQDNAHIAWWGYPDDPRSGVRSDVFYRKVLADFTATDVITVSTNTLNNDLGVALALDREGKAHLAWWGYKTLDSPQQPTAFYRHISDQLELGPIAELPTYSGAYKSTKTEIAVDALGTAHVVWEGTPPDMPSDIYYRAVRQDMTLTDMANLSSNNPSGLDSHPSIGTDAEGNAHVTWSAYEALNYRRVYSNTQLGAIIQLANPSGCGTSNKQTIRVGANGDSYVFWSTCTQNQYDVFLTKVEATQQVLEHTMVSTSTTTDDFVSDVTLDTVGIVHLLWMANSSTDSDVFYRSAKEGSAVFLPLVKR